jgi:hypothetical protein
MVVMQRELQHAAYIDDDLKKKLAVANDSRMQEVEKKGK